MNWKESRLVCLDFEWDNLWKFQVFLWLQNARSIKWWNNKNMNNLTILENLNKFLTMVHMSDLIEYDFQLVTSLQEHPFIPPLVHKIKCVTMTLWWNCYIWEMPIRPNKHCFEAWLRTSRLVLKWSEVQFFWQLDIGFVFYSKLLCLKRFLSR